MGGRTILYKKLLCYSIMAEIHSPHYLDIQMTTEFLKELTGISFDSFTEIQTGWNNKALIVVNGGKRLLRLSKPTWPKEKIYNEVAALKFLNQAPRIFDYGFHERAHWILMEYIEGEMLQDCWALLDEQEKRHVLLQIKEVIEKFQQYRFELIGGWMTPETPTLGPYFDGNYMFATEKEFLLGTLRQNLSKLDMDTTDIENLQPWISSTLDQLPPVPIVFFHGDIAFRNILFDKQTKKMTLVDWEWAGSRPVYFDWLEDMYDDSSEEKNWIRKELMAMGAYVYESIPGYTTRKLIADLIDSCAPWRFEVNHSKGVANLKRVVALVQKVMSEGLHV
jgi:hypothetical protein